MFRDEFSFSDAKEKEDFNLAFVDAFQNTNCFRQWRSVERLGLKEAPTGHPFHGNLNVNDIRMRIAQWDTCIFMIPKK